MKRTFTLLFASLFLCMGTMRAEVAADLKGKHFMVTEPATELELDTWYLLKSTGRNAYVSEQEAEDLDFIMKATGDVKGFTDAEANAGLLFKFATGSAEGAYTIVSGNGYYFSITASGNAVVPENNTSVDFLVGQAGEGTFYMQQKDNSVIADSNSPGETFCGWGTSVPSGTSGNNIWQFIPVDLGELVEYVYNFKYNNEVKDTQTGSALMGCAWPKVKEFPLGVSAAKVSGNINKYSLQDDGKAVKNVFLTLDFPFGYAENYEAAAANEDCWYNLIFHAKDKNYLYYDGTEAVLDATKTAVDENDAEAYLWAFVGNPFDGFTVVNKKAGAEKGLKAGADGAIVASAPQVMKLTTSTYGTDGFYMQATIGDNTDRFNKNQTENKVKYWSGADAGSTFMVGLVTETQKFAALKKEAMLLAEEVEYECAEEPELGQYSTAGYEAFVAAINDENATIASLEAALAAFDLTKNRPLFTIDGAGKDYMLGKSIFVDEEGTLKVKATDATDKSMLWAFDITETEVGVTDKVVVRNAATGELFWGADFIKVTETNENEGAGIADDGIFLFYANGKDFPVHAQNENGDVESVVTYWSYDAASGSAWKFTFVGVSNPAAYDLSKVKDEFVAKAGEFNTLADEELFTVLESMKEQWAGQNESVKELVARIEAGDLITKAEVASAMEEMKSYFSALESYDEYKVALANAKAVLEELKDWEFAENDQTYAKLVKTVNTVEAEEWFAVWQISDFKSQLENAVAPFYDIDSPLEGTGTGEVEWVDITTGSDAIVNPDLSSLKAPASWGGGFIWNATNNTDYDAENGVMEFVAGENTEASLIQEACPFVGVYRLTGKAYHKGAVNAVMFVGDKTVEIPAAEELTEISIVFEAEGTVYGPAYTEPDLLNIGYRCEFDNAEDVLVVGGFKLEKEEAKSFTLRDKFIQVVNMDSEDGFAGIGYWATDVFAFAEEYNKVLESVMPILEPVLYGQKVLKVKVEKAIADMEALMAKITPVVEYYEGTYKPAVADAEETLYNLNDASQAYEALAAALDVSEVDAVEDLNVDTRMAAINEAIKLVPTAVELDVEKATLTTSGATVQLTATVAGDETEKAVTWESDDETVAIVNENGLVTVVGNGKTFIVVYTVDYRITDTCKVTVNIEPTSIALDEEEVTLEIGESVQLEATIAPVEAEDAAVTWSSSNEAVATVDEYGEVTAVAVGEAVITVATANGKTATCTVTVVEPVVEVATVTLDKTEATLTAAGATVQLTATVAPADADDQTITWTTSDEKVATVDADGKVTAVANGTAVITATAANGVKATCTIVVAIPEDNGIDAIEADVNAVIYDIHGRRVEKMEKGFYIVNGKKVLVK